MGSILFIIVVVVVVIAVLVYRKAQGANATIHSVKESQTDTPEVKPVEQRVASEPAITQPSAQQEPVADKPVTPAKAKPVAQEEYAQVMPNLPDTIAELVSSLSNEKAPLARHRLLSQVTELTYKNRKDAQYRAACDYFSSMHVNEFDKIKAPLKKTNGGKLPQVMTFQNYANLLLEDERFDDAIEVCQQAIKFGLDDKTQTGFKGRIERIQAKQKKA